MKKCLIDIYTNELEWLGLIEDIETLILRSSWHEIINSELVVKKTAQGVDELQIGRILVINNNRETAVIIEEKTGSLEDQIWTYNLIPLKALLNYRVVHPTDSGSYTAKTQSNVMMNLVEKNCEINTRDTNRNFLKSDGVTKMFAVGSIKELGDTIDYVPDWESGFLGDAVIDIAKMNGTTSYPIGWNIYIHSAWQLLYMSCYQATIRTVNQSIVPPVVFSEEFGNLQNAEFIDSIIDFKNWGYVTWNNGSTDQISTVTNAKYGTAKYFNRKEIILDSSKKTSSGALNEGKSELVKNSRIQGFKADVINTENTISTYNIDWFLGDVVTIQSATIIKNQLLSLDVQITEVEETYENGEYSLSLTFGDGKLNFIQNIKNAINRK